MNRYLEVVVDGENTEETMSLTAEGKRKRLDLKQIMKEEISFLLIVLVIIGWGLIGLLIAISAFSDLVLIVTFVTIVVIGASLAIMPERRKANLRKVAQLATFVYKNPEFMAALAEVDVAYANRVKALIRRSKYKRLNRGRTQYVYPR